MVVVVAVAAATLSVVSVVVVRVSFVVVVVIASFQLPLTWSRHCTCLYRVRSSVRSHTSSSSPHPYPLLQTETCISVFIGGKPPRCCFQAATRTPHDPLSQAAPRTSKKSFNEHIYIKIRFMLTVQHIPKGMLMDPSPTPYHPPPPRPDFFSF